MKTFRFSLEAMLRIQRAFVRHEEMRLSKLLGERAQFDNSLNEVLQRSQRYSEGIQNAALETTSGAELAFGTLVMASYAQEASRIRAELHRLTPKIIEQRSRYLGAQREQEKLEKLEERARAAWMLEHNRREQQVADELYLLRRHAVTMTP